MVKEAYLKAVPSLTIEEYADTGKVEELESIIAENRQLSDSTYKNVDYLLTENRMFNERVKALETESRLQQLEFKEKMRQHEAQIDELRQGLMLVSASGLRVLPSRVVVTGEVQLEEYLNLGYVVEEELSPESPKSGVVDEIWELPDGRIMGEGDKFFALLKNDESVEMRGASDTLNDVERELVKYGVNVDEVERGKRYLLKKKQL